MDLKGQSLRRGGGGILEKITRLLEDWRGVQVSLTEFRGGTMEN